MSVSSEIENDTEPSVSRDTSIEENAKERAKVHRQQANKTRTAPRNHASLKVHQKASATIPGSRVKTLSMKSRFKQKGPHLGPFCMLTGHTVYESIVL